MTTAPAQNSAPQNAAVQAATPDPATRTQTPAPKAPRGLRPGPFRWLLVASFGDGIGDDIARSVLPVVAVAILGAGALETGGLNALGMAAFLLLGVPAGVLVDRWPRKKLLIGANAIRAAAVVSVPLAFAGGVLNLWHLFAVAAVVSAADVVFTAAHSAVMPTLLAGDQLARGYARVQAVQSGLAVATPALVGQLIRILAAPAVLIFSGVAYLFSAFVICGLPEVRTAASSAKRGFLVEARQGLACTWGQPLVRSLMVSVALINAAGMWGGGAKVVFLLKTLHIAPDQAVALGAVSAAGGLAAALLTPKVTLRYGIGRTKIGAGLAAAASLLLTPAAPVLGLQAIVWVGLSGFGWSFFVVMTGLAGSGIVPRLIPAELMGRAMSTYRLATLGIMPVASLAGGCLAEYAGEIPVLWSASLIAASSVLPVIASPLRRWTAFPEHLEAALSGEPATAPIV